MEECSLYHTSSPAQAVISVFDLGHSYRNLRVVFICISLMAKDVEYFLKCLSSILDSSVESSLFRSVFHFLNWIICSFDDQFLEFFVYFGDQTSV